MVSKANATAGSASSIDYIEEENDKKKAVELDRNLISGEGGNEILREFREVQALKPNVKKNTYSMILSPDSSQKKFSQDELRELGKEHLKNLGLEKHQYLMTLHQATGRDHLHFQVNRISIDGKCHDDSLISIKSQESADKLAKARNLITAKEIKKIKMEPTKELRAEIFKAYNFSKKFATNFDEFEKKMNDKGYDIVMSRQKKTNKIQGFSIYDRQSEKTFKASDIHKNVRYNKLQENLKNNREKRSERANNLKNKGGRSSKPKR